MFKKFFVYSLTACTASLLFSSCGSDIQDKYIELLESRVEELSENKEELPEKDRLTVAEVESEIFRLLTFKCPSIESSLLVQAKSLTSSKWMVRIEFESAEMDEFGFHSVVSETILLSERNNELSLDTILKKDLLCD